MGSLGCFKCPTYTTRSCTTCFTLERLFGVNNNDIVNIIL